MMFFLLIQLGQAVGREWLHQVKKVHIFAIFLSSRNQFRCLSLNCYDDFSLISLLFITFVSFFTICRTDVVGQLGICGMLANPMYGTGGYILDEKGHFIDPSTSPHYPGYVLVLYWHLQYKYNAMLLHLYGVAWFCVVFDGFMTLSICLCFLLLGI